MPDDDIYDDIDDMADDVCPGCGADFSEFHDEDCPYADDDYEDDEVQP
jgi:hypothetical protein